MIKNIFNVITFALIFLPVFRFTYPVDTKELGEATCKHGSILGQFSPMGETIKDVTQQDAEEKCKTLGGLKNWKKYDEKAPGHAYCKNGMEVRNVSLSEGQLYCEGNKSTIDRFKHN